MFRFPTFISRPVSALATAALVTIAVAAAPVTADAWVDPSTGLSHPTKVTRRAEIPEKNWLPGHRGVDLALRPGQAVRAAAGGEVAFAGVVVGVPVVSIVHPDGLRSTYQPVDPHVAVGQHVAEGQQIGTLSRVAPSARAAHDGLHWGVLTGPDTYIDPLTLLDAPIIRLKPVDGPGRKPF